MKNKKDSTQVYGISANESNLYINEGARVNISNTSGYGVKVDEDWKINGGHMMIQGSMTAVVNYNSIELGTSDYSNTGVINVATDYDGLYRQVFDKDTCR